VARHLAGSAAPAGVQIVAASPFYHRVRAEIGVVIDPAADPGDTVRRLAAALDDYVHPIRGGEDGGGWPFGGSLRYSPLLRRLVTGVDGVRAITRLTLVVDGARLPACTDFRRGRTRSCGHATRSCLWTRRLRHELHGRAEALPPARRDRGLGRLD
jgi:hypothetical protein